MNEQHLEFLSLNGGCTGSYESTLVKMPQCWHSHVAAHMYVDRTLNEDYAHDFDEPKRLVTMASELIKTLCKIWIQDYKKNVVIK